MRVHQIFGFCAEALGHQREIGEIFGRGQLYRTESALGACSAFTTGF